MNLPLDAQVSFVPMEDVSEDGTFTLGKTRALGDVWQGYTYFRDGDVVVAKITPCFENGKGALFGGLMNGVGFGTTEFHVLRPGPDIDPRFLFYVTRSQPFRQLGVAAMYGAAGQQRVPESFISDFRIGVPRLPEQRAIADFLDRKTVEIDALNAKFARLIALMEERWVSLITHAVTKGLGCKASMKDSGIPWFGKIPAHWDILQLRRIVRSFVDYRGRTPEKTEEGITLITARNIQNGSLTFGESHEYIREEDYDDWMVRGLPETGDVLLTTEAPLGSTAQIEDPHVALAQRIILFKTDPETIINGYLKYFFLSMSGQSELWSRATGSTAEGIKASHLRGIRVPVPPIPDQLIITERLDTEENRLMPTIIEAENAINRLQEYRVALIFAAVTGKIDVRKERS